MEQAQGNGRLAGLAQGFLFEGDGAVRGHESPNRPVAIGQVAGSRLRLIAGDGGQGAVDPDEVGGAEGIGVGGLSVDGHLDDQQVFGRRDPGPHAEDRPSPGEGRGIFDPLSGAQGVENLGGLQPLFGVVNSVEERRDVQIDGRDRAGMAVGIDGLGLPEVVLGDPESVAFWAVGDGRGAGGHLGAAILAQSVVAQALGHRADGHAEVAVAQQRPVREFPRGHQNGWCVEDSGGPSHLTEGLGSHIGTGFRLGGAPQAHEKSQKEQSEGTSEREEGWHGAVASQAAPGRPLVQCHGTGGHGTSGP
jgi:hypothetical protein